MEDGSLFVHSPVEWTPTLGKALEKLGGDVKHIVSPNYEHLKYATQWHEQYPEAFMYACPGLPDRMKNVKWKFELSSQAPNSLLENGIESVYFDCEINPFTGKPFFNEVVFYHKKSRTLMMSDVFWNYPSTSLPNYIDVDDRRHETGYQHFCPKVSTSRLPEERLPAVPVPLGTSLWKAGMDRVYWPFYKRFMVGSTRRPRYLRAVEKLLEWSVEVVAPCHGDVIKGRQLCAHVLQNHFLA